MFKPPSDEIPQYRYKKDGGRVRGQLLRRSVMEGRIEWSKHQPRGEYGGCVDPESQLFFEGDRTVDPAWNKFIGSDWA
jgi:hypothetical protein